MFKAQRLEKVAAPRIPAKSHVGSVIETTATNTNIGADLARASREDRTRKKQQLRQEKLNKIWLQSKQEKEEARLVKVGFIFDLFSCL